MSMSDLAIQGPLPRAGAPPASATPTTLPPAVDPARCEGELGTSSGVNIAPGSDDDGWIVPPPVKLSDGTQVQLYKDGEALHAAYEAVKNAKRRICLEVYIFANDDTGKAFDDLLCEKASQGVQVYLIYDALGSLGGGGDVFKRLRQCGGRVEPFHPIFPWELKFSWRPWNRDHRKLLVIDDEIAGLGGLNVGHNYAGSWVVSGSKSDAKECDLWRDNAMGIRGPGARMFLESFAASWRYVTRGGRVERAEYLRNVNQGELGVLASVPTTNSPLRPMLHQLLADARESIQLTMAYFAPDDPLVQALCRAARRGVKVQLMLPGRSDVRALRAAARSFYETLMTAGVEVYERQTVVLHAKTMVIDGFTTLLGSTNLDYRSIEYNLELSAIVRSRAFGKQAQALFQNDVRFAKRINLGEWRKRPTLDRFGQWAVSRARYLL